ncbi:MAG: NAD(P)H-dependent oxidoreductase [Bacteroidia bacterium]|nr:NAD(P)H-dependent oxidoreductase [Bacteroidia bacterium]
MKKILIINGHPDTVSFNYALSEAYRQGAESSGAGISQINIAELDFDPNLKNGYRQRMDLEKDLLEAIEKIKAAEHLVWVFPMWWYGLPALMKGFIDRTFLPGITFAYQEGKPLPKKLLAGKTARIIVTADTPAWYSSLFMRNPAINQLKRGILQFCGIKPVKLTYLAMLRGSSPEVRNRWLAQIHELGRKLR